jgi:F-type H+-transporting ATPase subunit b
VKGLGGWLLIFVCSLIFTFFVDLGDNFFGLPEVVIQTLFAANLTLFLWLLARFAGRPMGSFLDTRRQGIGDQLEQAKTKLAEAEQLRDEVKERLGKVEQEVAQLVGRADREGEAQAQQISEQAAREQQRFVKRIDDEIARRQVEARQMLAQEAADLTARLTRELLERELTEPDRRRLLDASLAALQANEEE